MQAPEGLPPGDGLEQVILVPPDGDPEPVRFWFHARSPGSHRLHITTWAGGTFLAELEVEVSVEAGGAFGVQRGAIAVLGEPRARPGEVTLLVRSDGTRYVFQLLSDEYLFEPVHARTLTADPGVAVERAITTLKQLAEGRGPYAGKAAQRWIRETGVGLWNDVVPAVIKASPRRPDAAPKVRRGVQTCNSSRHTMRSGMPGSIRTMRRSELASG